ncbi:SDR family oxidoreductase [Rhodopila sp.]|jgi:citronellol/citronellal dehydrogenase|uniref:SDR family oxidoreductase n=1 Tax=Rhodopila sp. TaxID=2480087 RepID=UPI002BE3459D|nr:SDR family oxidoreductase [Rhodopila sp.]HVZ06288.1 SDR family oxidoreductase [Rhodopila sp.]
MTQSFGFSDEFLATQPLPWRDGLFEGKRVLVSGAGSGLGKCIATTFTRLGADLVIVGRRRERLEEAAAFFGRFGRRITIRPMTIRNPDEVHETFAFVQREVGGIDILVNNAGGQFPQAAIDFSVKGWNAVIDTNLNGTWYMMQTAARQWAADKRPGCIVNVVVDFWRGMPGIAHTCAARAGVVYLSKTVAVEWAPLNIRVNCVAPGAHETSGFAVYPPEGLASFLESNPMRRVGDAQDVADACAYLAASTGKFITGEVLTVDGGQQLWGDMWPTGRPDYFKL